MPRINILKRLIKIITKDEYHIGKFRIKGEYVWLGIILITAILLRIIQNTPSVYSFWVDEAEYANRSIYILDHGGQYDIEKLYDHPPLFMYLQAVFFLIFGNEWYVARGLMVFIGILNVYIFYLIGREWRDRRLGLILGALFAVQPLAVFIARQVLLENLLLLFLSLSFLTIIKHKKTGKQHYFLFSITLLGLAFITKFTGAIFIVPLIAYIFMKKIHKNILLLYSFTLLLLIVMPILYIMLPIGFMEFHFRKTSGEGYVVGDVLIYLGHFIALAMTFMWLNVGMVPFIDFFQKRFSDRRGNANKLKHWISSNSLTFFVIIWALTSLIFFSLFTFMTPQYIFMIMVPILILLGLILYRASGLLKILIISYLVISASFVLISRHEGSHETVEFLQRHVKDGDTICANDKAVFEYYFPNNDIYYPTESNILSLNASFIVLKTTFYEQILKNDTITDFLQKNYVVTFKTEKGVYDVNFVVLERR